MGGKVLVGALVVIKTAMKDEQLLLKEGGLK